MMKPEYTRIFLLSHMRASTSLAGHILGSHPDINGYYEMHLNYEDATVLDKQLGSYQLTDALKDNSYYLFDKLLHNDYTLNINIQALSDSKVLVSLQAPDHTIKSIINLFSKKEIDDLYASPAGAINYYIERVQALAAFCQLNPKKYYYYDAEVFQVAPTILLPTLSRWLELTSPLSEEYQVFSQTGVAGKGDSSKSIQSQKINRTSSDYSHIKLPVDKLNRAQEVYISCRQLIIDNAIDAVIKESS